MKKISNCVNSNGWINEVDDILCNTLAMNREIDQGILNTFKYYIFDILQNVFNFINIWNLIYILYSMKRKGNEKHIIFIFKTFAEV